MSEKFNHAVTIAFAVISSDRNGDDFTPDMLKRALQQRISELDSSTEGRDWLEAVGAPFDTMVVEAGQ